MMGKFKIGDEPLPAFCKTPIRGKKDVAGADVTMEDTLLG